MLRALAAPAKSIELDYRASLPVPDLLGAATVRHLAEPSRALIRPPFPSIVVAAGRLTAPVARWIKRRSPRTILMQIMRPGSLRGLDLIAVPEHDGVRKSHNVIWTVGAPHGLDRTVLDAAAAEAATCWTDLPAPRVAVLLGGPSRHQRFGGPEAKAVADQIEGFARDLGASLMLTTSPRTPDVVVDLISGSLTVPHAVHRFGSPGPNPYEAVLGLADRVVVTSDSASMLSEACATGRPVHVVQLPGTPRKLLDLIDNLRTRGWVHPFNAMVSEIPPPLNDAATIADALRERLQAQGLSLPTVPL